MMSPSKGAYGIVLELKHLGHKHKVVQRGGVPGERDAEAGPDGRPLFVTHVRNGENRWCLPEGFVSIPRMFINIEQFAGIDVETALLMNDVFAD